MKAAIIKSNKSKHAQSKPRLLAERAPRPARCSSCRHEGSLCACDAALAARAAWHGSHNDKYDAMAHITEEDLLGCCTVLAAPTAHHICCLNQNNSSCCRGRCNSNRALATPVASCQKRGIRNQGDRRRQDKACGNTCQLHPSGTS